MMDGVSYLRNLGPKCLPGLALDLAIRGLGTNTVPVIILYLQMNLAAFRHTSISTQWY